VPQGILVVNVVSGSPAENSGIKVGDIIFKINGNGVGTDTNSLSGIIAKQKPGDLISLDIWRKGETVNIKASLGSSSQ
jgi:serine protease Do